jgi:prevent-host-death family protein
MAYEIPVTQARAELADLINRVVYGGERVVVTRHGKPLVALVSAADLERLAQLEEIEHIEDAEKAEKAEKAADAEGIEGVRERAEEPMISSVSRIREVASAPREQHRFGITAEHRGPTPS